MSADWQVVFLAKPGISTSTNIWTDWTRGSASTTDDPSCLEDPCSKHYRSALLDSWSSDGIIKVSWNIGHSFWGFYFQNTNPYFTYYWLLCFRSGTVCTRAGRRRHLSSSGARVSKGTTGSVKKTCWPRPGPDWQVTTSPSSPYIGTVNCSDKSTFTSFYELFLLRADILDVYMHDKYNQTETKWKMAAII